MRCSCNPRPSIRRSYLRAGAVLILIIAVINVVAPVSPALGAEAQRTKRILILFAENKFLPGNALVEQAARRVLEKSGQPLEFYAEYLDASRFPGQNYYQLFRQYLQAKYALRPPDIILAFLTTQFELAGELPAELFPKVPVVFGALTEDKIQRARFGKNATGLAVRTDVKGTIDSILQLQPETQRIVVIGGTAPLDKVFLRKTEEAAPSLSKRVQFDFWVTRPMNEIRSAVASLPPRTVILFTNMFLDAAGETFVPEVAASLVAASASVPVYVLIETNVGGGAVGGKVAHFEAAGTRVGELAQQILNGAAPSSLPIEVYDEGTPMFDWRALKRWGISESQLPPGSIVRFRQPSVWEQYYWYIMGALVIIALEAFLIIALLLHRARRRRAEADLRESEQRMSLAASAAKLGMWMWDVQRDHVWVTSEGRRFFGWGNDEPINLAHFLDTLHRDDRELVRQAISRSLEHGDPYAVEYRVCEHDGNYRWISAQGEVEFDGARKPLRMRGVAIDITERKRAEAELQQHREQLAHVTRISTVSELTASVAHELNQPLGAILSNAEAAEMFLKMEPPALDEIRDILLDIRKDDQRASEVIRRMRSLLRKQELTLQPVDINSAAEEALKVLRLNASARKVVITFEGAPDLPRVWSDPVHLQQLLLNLVLNGMEAMAEIPEERRRVVVQTQRGDNGAATVSVADYGPGIPADKLANVFEPFFTTKKHGMGMGLSIARTIVEAHHGQIWAENNPRAGATFYFTVPWSKEDLS